MDSTNQLHDMNKQQLGTLIANQQKLGTSRDIYRTWQVNIIQSDIQHAWMYMNCSSDFLAGMQPRLGMECISGCLSGGVCARLLIDIRRPWPRRGGAWDHGRCAAWAVAPPGQLWHASRPCKLFLLGFETATWHALGTFKSLKSSKLSAAAVEGSSIRHHGTPLGPRPYKQFLLRFETATWHVDNSYVARFRGSKSSAAAFEAPVSVGFQTARWHVETATWLETLQCSFRQLPYTAPGYVPRPRKVFLLDFKTATWHVLAPFKSLKSSKPSAETCAASAVAPPVPAFASKYAASRPCKLCLLGF